jgi:hypothetical protein
VRLLDPRDAVVKIVEVWIYPHDCLPVLQP